MSRGLREQFDSRSNTNLGTHASGVPLRGKDLMARRRRAYPEGFVVVVTDSFTNKSESDKSYGLRRVPQVGNGGSLSARFTGLSFIMPCASWTARSSCGSRPAITSLGQFSTS